MAGYLGAIPVPQATQHRESFTATSGQTTFNTAGYTVGFLDVYLNGSHLSPADFTATNGSDVVLASGASADDVCDIISYTAFEVNSQTFTGTTTLDGAVVINESSADVDFRVESNGNANMLFVDGGNDRVGIGTSSPNFTLQLDSQRADATFDANNLDTWADFKIQGQTASGNARGIYFDFDNDTGNDKGAGIVGISGDGTGGVGSLGFITTAGNSSAERMRIDSSGNVGIGTSSPVGTFVVEATVPKIQATTGSKHLEFGVGGSGCGLVMTDGHFMTFNHQPFANRGTDTNLTERMRIDSTGAVTMPAQPAFQVTPSSGQLNVPINATQTVVFGTEIFDQNADFASNTFTAPVTGKYQFNTHLRIDNWDVSANYYQLYIITSNRNYISTWDAALHASTDQDYITLTLSTLADMDASDTAKVGILQSGGAAQADISGQSTFSGYLVA